MMDANKLPIVRIKDELIEVLTKKQVIFVSTPTSSGKTMFVPQLCSELGGGIQVWCSQPRVVLCREAQKGANMFFFNDNPREGAAYATGKGDSYNLEQAKVVYATEGSIIARKIWKKLGAGDFLLVDEVHEQNIGVEKLIALTDKFVSRGVKVVFMSATMDLDKYVAHFERDNVKVGKIEMAANSQSYSVEYQTVDDPVSEVVRLVQSGKRGLIGVEGKDSIEKLTGIAKAIDPNLKVFAMHGDLDIEEQDAALQYKDAALYIATNIVQSGITIDGISCGWFNGYGNEIRNMNGCATLVRYELSQAEMKQWFGRLGRTCEGIIFQTPKEVEKFSKRNANPTPEILRIPLLDTVLDFAGIGLDLETAKLLNKPNKKEINLGKYTLTRLKCLNKKGHLTDIGQSVCNYGVGVRMGIVKHKAKEFGNVLLGEQIAAINRYGSPLKFVKVPNTVKKIINKYSNQNKRYSGYMVAIDIVEYFITQYGLEVKQMDWSLFAKECDEWGLPDESGFVKGGLHKKTLMALMKEFGRIEAVNEEPVLSSNVKYILECAYSDQIIEHGDVYEENLELQGVYACPVLGDNYGRMVGDIVRINTGRKPFALLEISTSID